MTRAAQDGPHRLLVVDDDRLILDMIEDFFGSRGFVVDPAEGAQAALERIDEARPDIIVTDILMPEMDGWEFYERVRSTPGTEDMPFVFLTTESELSQRLRALRLGADDYVTKPFAVEELHARVERILERVATGSREGDSADLLLAGSVEHLAISDLLQILSLSRKDARVTLARDGEEGTILFTDGEIVDARAGRAAGRKALYRMLGWHDARFRVTHPEPSDAAGEGAVGLRTSEALMDGLVALDEWNRWRAQLPAPDAVLEPLADAGATGPASAGEEAADDATTGADADAGVDAGSADSAEDLGPAAETGDAADDGASKGAKARSKNAAAAKAATPAEEQDEDESDDDLVDDADAAPPAPRRRRRLSVKRPAGRARRPARKRARRKTPEETGTSAMSAAQSEVLDRARRGQKIGEMLEDSALPDAELARAICELIESGALRAVGSEER